MVKGTRENIVNSFFSLAAKYPDRSNFSLAEIAHEAGISRQAIYKNHFNNSQEILNYIENSVDDKINALMARFDPSTNDIETYMADIIIPELYEHKLWLRYLYSTAANPNWRRFLQETYREWLTNNLTIDKGGLPLQEEFINNLLVNSTLAIIESWITQEVPAPPESFSKQFLQVLRTPLSQFVS